MTKTNYKKVIETNADGLKIEKIDEKKLDVKKPDGSIEKVKYKTVKFTFEHPTDAGGSIRGGAVFGLPKMEHPRGIKMDNGKLSVFTTFDTTDPDVDDLISDKKLTQSRGWIFGENVKTQIKGGKSVAKAKRDVELYSSPSDEGDVVASFSKGEIMNVEDQNEDDTWYLVSAGGKDGFFSIMRNRISDLLIEEKIKIGYGDKTDDDIRRTVKNAIYWPVDKETGKLVEGKSPNSFFKVSYFRANPKEGKKESFAKYNAPGIGNLDLETMTKSALSLSSSVIKLVDVYIGGGKIVPNYYISDAVVVDISEIKAYNELEDEIKEMNKDEELVAKLKKQMAASKKFEAPASKMSTGTSQEEAAKSLKESGGDGDSGDRSEEEDGDDISDLLDDGPKLKTNVKIPGLPDDDD
jgi:hypothetical protein